MLAADGWVSAGDGKNVIESALDGTVYDLESGKVCHVFPLLSSIVLQAGPEVHGRMWLLFGT